MLPVNPSKAASPAAPERDGKGSTHGTSVLWLQKLEIWEPKLFIFVSGFTALVFLFVHTCAGSYLSLYFPGMARRNARGVRQDLQSQQVGGVLPSPAGAALPRGSGVEGSLVTGSPACAAVSFSIRRLCAPVPSCHAVLPSH